MSTPIRRPIFHANALASSSTRHRRQIPASPTLLLALLPLLTGIQQCQTSTDEDGDEWSIEDGDCDDTNPNTYPGAEEQCDGIDNDCDEILDNGYADTDGDASSNCIDTDDDNDGTVDSADFDPLNAQVNAVPLTQLYIPGSSTLYVYPTQSGSITIEMRGSDGTYQPISGSPFSVSGGFPLQLSTEAGDYRLTGSASFSAFYAALNDGGDQVAAGVAEDGSMSGKTVISWAHSYLVVQALETAAGTVTVERFTGDGWTVQTSLSLSSPFAASTLSMPGRALYRVTASDGPVTAYGSIQANAANHFEYLSADDGSTLGTSYHYQSAPYYGSGSLVMMALEPDTSVQVDGGSAINLSATGSITTAYLSAGHAYQLTGSRPFLAWVEVTPGNGSCDGTILDLDLVPGLNTGMELDTEFVFSTTISPNECYTERRPDIDVLAIEASHVVAESLQSGTFVVLAEEDLEAGERWRVGTNFNPGTVLRISSDRPVTVQHSHDTFEWAGSTYSYSHFRQ